MGLSAFVRCNCFENGKAAAPPFPRNWLYFDSGGYISLRPEHDNESNRVHFDEWTCKCCEHFLMEFASEHIGNWMSCAGFEAAVERAGTNRFPLLSNILPDANGGMFSTQDAKQALVELEVFGALPDTYDATVLVDNEGYELFNYVEGSSGLFVLDGRHGTNIGIGNQEFFVQDRKTAKKVFQAIRIGQRLLDPVRQNEMYDGRVEFRDLDVDVTYVCRTPVGGRTIRWPDGRDVNNQGQVNQSYPPEFYISSREVRSGDYAFLTEPLKRILQASVETGNPVQWC